MAVDDNDASFTVYVAEGFVVGTGDDVAAIAAHEAELGTWDRGEMLFHPCFGIATGAWGGVY